MYISVDLPIDGHCVFVSSLNIHPNRNDNGVTSHKEEFMEKNDKCSTTENYDDHVKRALFH